MIKEIRKPSPVMLAKIQRARNAIVTQKQRVIKCPYCLHSSIIVFEDTRGHVQTKCKKCNTEVVIDVLNMRKFG